MARGVGRRPVAGAGPGSGRRQRDATPTVNVGSCLLDGGLYSRQQGYDISFVPGTLTVNKAHLVLSAADVDKTCDGTTAATLDLRGASFAGMIAGDDLRLGGATGRFVDRNVAAGKTARIDGITLAGTDAGNYRYNVTAATTAGIWPATLVYRADPGFFWRGHGPAR